MRDVYLYQDVDVLKNKLGIKEQEKLNDAEADYVSFRLKQLATDGLSGEYDFEHLLKMHWFIFQDLYEWAGEPRRLNICKEEPVLGGLSIEYSDVFDIANDATYVLRLMSNENWQSLSKKEISIRFSDYLAKLWKVHCFREGNTRTVITFCCQFADEHNFPIDRTLFEENSAYVRTALVAYTAVFSDLGDLSQKEHLQRIVFDALE